MMSRFPFTLALLSLGCALPDPSPSTGGTDIAPGKCGRGLVVVHSDYASTNVSLLGLDGVVLSGSFISSASGSPGLSAPFSGDVVVPTMPVTTDRIVLIDRYPASVLTWVDVKSAQVSSQLSVATGFVANPHDYVELSAQKAYVTRYEPNFAAGGEPFDQGNDILIVNPSAPAILDRIDMMPAMQGEDPKFFPRTGRAVRVNDRVYALLSGYSADFKESAPSRVVAVDVHTDTIAGVLTLNGMHGCDGVAISPQGDQLAVSCSGEFGGDSVSTLPESGLVLVDIKDTLSEHKRFPAQQFGEGSLGFSVSYAGAGHIIFTTFGREAIGMDPGADDTVIQLQLDTGEFNVLLRSSGQPFTLGEVRCASACHVCFVADAKTAGGVVHSFDVNESGQLVNPRQIKIETAIGLPPRYIGAF